MKKRIVITGGHLTPALAVIEELQKRGGWEIYFFGRKYAAEGEKVPSLESLIIPEKGIWFIPISAGRLQKKFTRYTIPAALKIPLGFFQAFFHLLRLRPKVILSFGGYVSVPVVVAGWPLGIPAVTHEQTTVAGRATKINSFFAKKICISWPQTTWMFPKKKSVLTGNPIRQEIFKVNQKLWQALKFEKGRPLILVTGGNQGSHAVNLAVEGCLKKILAKYNLFQQTGHLQALGDFERLEKLRSQLPPNLQRRYHLKKYIFGEEWGTLLSRADLVVSRAGMNTLTELAALGKPLLLIPHPWVPKDEQTKNAQMLKEAGLAEILPQEKLTPRLLFKMIEKMIKNLGFYQSNSIKAKKLVKLNAASKIADEVEKIS